MSMMNSEIYDALLDAGASQEKAKAAAESVADIHGRLDKIDQKLTHIEKMIYGLYIGVILLLLSNITNIFH